jgi:hypothetical protein
MELNIPNPDNPDFPLAFGITPERQQELSNHLNAMVDSWVPNNIIRVQDIVCDIAFFCRGPEEFAYCIILHMGWWQRRGHQLAPR